jgi:hypothetical protein
MKAIYARYRRVLIMAVSNLSVAAVLLAAIPAHAQQVTPGSYTDLSQYLISGNQIVPRQALSAGPAASTGGLSSSVTQIGQGNVASATLNGASNITTQYQSGANNSSTLSVNGTQNAITTSQIGNSNSTSIDVAGNGNSISNLQVGSGLSYQLQVVGKSVPISVQQFGRK